MTTKKQQIENGLKTNAIISIILPIVGWFMLGLIMNIIALVLAIKVLNTTKVSTTKTLATIGLVMSIIMLSILVISIIILASTGAM